MAALGDGPDMDAGGFDRQIISICGITYRIKDQQVRCQLEVALRVATGSVNERTIAPVPTDWSSPRSFNVAAQSECPARQEVQ
jgi:hypothetical protein